MATTRLFSRAELDELELPWTHVDAWVVNEGRWSVDKAVVFEFEGIFWQVEAAFPATEMQEGQDPWNDQETVAATLVEKREVAIECWMPVETDAAH